METLCPLTEGLLGIDGYCKLEKQPFGVSYKYNKLFSVDKNGFAEAIVSIGSFSNANTCTAVVQIFPNHTSEKIKIKYLLGEKYEENGYAKIYYTSNQDGSFTLYNTSLNGYVNSYIFISKYLVTTHNQQIDNLPSEAIQI